MRSPPAIASETAGHLLQVNNHVAEGSCQFANFVFAIDINSVVEIAGVADFASDTDEV